MPFTIYCRPEDDWLFGTIARPLAQATGSPIVDRPQGCCYVLSNPAGHDGFTSFIPLPAIDLAADKRAIEQAFHAAGIARPRTWILGTEAEVEHLVAQHPQRKFIVKYPTSCGSSGHYTFRGRFTPKKHWPLPFIVQEFLLQETPGVHRVYFSGGACIGSNVRRFPAGVRHDLIAHAKGARYCYDDPVDAAGIEQARRALLAVGLLDSFGVVDLLRVDGAWYALEVGTDGIHNIVDRDVGNDAFLALLTQRIADAFIQRCAAVPAAG